VSPTREGVRPRGSDPTAVESRGLGSDPQGPTPSDHDLARVAAVAGAVLDPEIPVLTLADLGVMRGVETRENKIVVKLTPTYTGCPATLAIRRAVGTALIEAGFDNFVVETVLAPPWSTDDITAEGRAKLKAYGIAPPAGRASVRALFGAETIACPKCNSIHTTKLAEFGSTPCKALWRCETCREPFDAFKCL
jgi:ring-1,2-phenylacetyl-CoA epoxidase subunit PaaD